MALDLGIMLAVAAMVSWGVADFLAKKAIDQVGYRTSIVISQVVAFLPTALIGFILFQGHDLYPLLFGAIILAGVSGVIGYIFLYRGFGKGNVSVVAPISASWSVITALIAVSLLGENLLPVQKIGIVIVFLGVFFASTNLADLKLSVKKGKWSAGALDAIIAMIAWGISYALLKPITSAIGPVMALLFLKLIAMSSLLSWIGVTRYRIAIPKNMTFMLLAVAGLLDFFAFLTFNYSLDTQYVSIVSAIVATAPAITIGLAYVFLKERIVNNQKLGILAILVGLVLVSLA
jgi:drug/metabolite transporter (DMT)-like permease